MIVEHYTTAKGSTVEVWGAHRGRVTISFDWLEEGACIEAVPDACVANPGDEMLNWSCGCCGSGSARLERQPTP